MTFYQNMQSWSFSTKNPNSLYSSLKGQCQKIFNNVFVQKTIFKPHMNRQKRFRDIFCFHDDICEKSGQRLRCHHVRVVNDYADTDKTMRTLFENC